MVQGPAQTTVAAINAVCRETSLDAVISVGRLVLRRFFGNDLDAWAQRAEDRSFWKLARHDDLSIGPSELCRRVAIYETCMRLGIVAWKHVSAEHVRVVLGFSQDEQERLLATAEKGAYSVRALAHQVSKTGAAGITARADRRASRLDAALSRLAHVATEVDELLAETVREPGPAGSAQARDLVTLTARVRHLLSSIDDRFADQLP
jgi:hypothetical protein